VDGDPALIPKPFARIIVNGDAKGVPNEVCFHRNAWVEQDTDGIYFVPRHPFFGRVLVRQNVFAVSLIFFSLSSHFA
jgi:hypothetical protein